MNLIRYYLFILATALSFTQLQASESINVTLMPPEQVEEANPQADATVTDLDQFANEFVATYGLPQYGGVDKDEAGGILIEWPSSDVAFFQERFPELFPFPQDVIRQDPNSSDYGIEKTTSIKVRIDPNPAYSQLIIFISDFDSEHQIWSDFVRSAPLKLDNGVLTIGTPHFGGGLYWPSIPRL